MKSLRDTVVGLVFFGIVGLLLFYTVIIGNIAVVTGERDIRVRFPQVGGLNIGQDIRVAGVDVGTVKDLQLQDDGTVIATLTIPVNVKIFENDSIRIIPFSLLGGSYVSVERGSPTGPERDLSQILPDGQGPVDIMRGLAEMFRPGGKIDNIATNISNLTDRLNDPQAGLLGKLISDPGLALKVDELIDKITSFATYLRDVARLAARGDGEGGGGTVYRLLHDDSLYENLDGTLENVRVITQRLEDGEGSAGRLLTEDRLYEDLEATVASLRRITEEIQGGRGALGVLVNDERTGENLARTVENVEELTRSVREGRGTIGRLWTDPALFDEARRTLVELRESTEDLREQAPINAFLGAALSAF